MKIGLLYDRLSMEEKLILGKIKNAEKININKLVIPLNFKSKFDVLINRIESKYKRRFLTKIFESKGAQVINYFALEDVCSSKFETKCALAEGNVSTSKCYFKIGFPFVKKAKQWKLNMTQVKEARNMLENIGEFISKPDQGSRGASVLKFNNITHFYETLKEYEETTNIPEAFKQCLMSPAGIFIEEFEPHALDLRIVVYKKRGEKPKVFGCLGRAAADEKTIAKNTSLGGIPVGVPLLSNIESISYKAMRAVSEYCKKIYGKEIDYYLVGLDIIPRNEILSEREKVYKAVKNAYKWFMRVNEAKKTRDLKKIDERFRELKMTEEYKKLQQICLEYIEKSVLLVTEINTTPDYAVNTRNLVGDVTSVYSEVVNSIIKRP
ncbi:MAG: hypothetical protein ACTSSJ_04360 [Candidatus Odinarchaeia archaeon]